MKSPSDISSSANRDLDDEQAFIRALEQSKSASPIPAVTPPSASSSLAADDELAFIHALEKSKSIPSSPAMPDSPPASAEETAETSPQDVSGERGDWSCLKLQVAAKLLAPENIPFLEQLKDWQTQCQPQAERLNAYLAVLCRLGRTASNDVVYLILRETGRALCDCLNATSIGRSQCQESLNGWASLVKRLSPLPCRLRIPFLSGFFESSWMRSKYSPAVRCERNV